MQKHYLTKIAFFVLAAGFFLSFIFFSVLVHKNLFSQLDFNTTVKLQDRIPHRVDYPFSVLSLIGNIYITGAFLAIVLVLRRKIAGILVFLLFLGFHGFELFGKVYVDHLPPPEFMVRTIRDIQMSAYHVRTENSYPSGHSARAIFLTVVFGVIILRSQRLSYVQKLLLFCVIVGYDFIMLLSRIYLGEHWTTDVAGGAILGLSFGFLSALAL